MPKFRVNVSIEQRGSLFNAAHTKTKAQAAVIQVNEAIAVEGVTRLHAYLGRHLRNPSGYYRSRVVVERRQIYRGITDSGVVYGTWLEGTSSRNRTSTFKGYHAFKNIKQELMHDKEKIAAPIIAQLINELGG